MFDTSSVTFAVAVNKIDIFNNNFMMSPCFGEGHSHQVLVQQGFSSAAKAYNEAIDRSTNDLIVFAHQDVVFPASWLADLQRALESLQRTDPSWGVLGCYGEPLTDFGRGFIYSGDLGILGKPFDGPAPVQTLDEVVLVLRKSSGLRFDQDLPHFHFYGADICMAAAAHGMKSYAISAFCVHNTERSLVLPREFYESYKHLKRRWRSRLPIRTTCVRITRFNTYMYKKRIQEACLRLIGRTEINAVRVKDGRQLLAQLEQASQNAADVVPVNCRCACQ